MDTPGRAGRKKILCICVSELSIAVRKSLVGGEDKLYRGKMNFDSWSQRFQSVFLDLGVSSVLPWGPVVKH